MSENSLTQAKAQLSSIVEMVENLRKAHEEENGDAIHDAETAIHNDALSVEVRTDWHAPGDAPNADVEFRILLCTGGPAVKISGNLNEHSEPVTANLFHQDWWEPWAPIPNMSEYESESLLEYCRCFWFGE